jgi:hypothetical protein
VTDHSGCSRIGLVLAQLRSRPVLPEPRQWDWMMQAQWQFAQAVDQQGGKILGGEALQPTATATSVRTDGQVVNNGPFVVAKEALGGFCLIEATDPQQALAFARQCPAPGGGVQLPGRAIGRWLGAVGGGWSHELPRRSTHAVPLRP